MGRSSSWPPSRSTGSERGRWAPTPSEEPGPAGIVAALRAQLGILDAGSLSGASGIEICGLRTDAFDRALGALIAPFVSEGLAFVAVGGYGRRELCPGSDLDLLFVHEPGLEDAVHRLADAVLYPLWDADLAVSHAVRTIMECRSQAEADLASLTAILDARPLAGSATLLEAVGRTAPAVVESDRQAFVSRIRESRRDRKHRFGSLGRILEGDVRDAAGGLRDVHVLHWLSRAGMRARDGEAEPDHRLEGRHAAEPERDFLLLLRTALHRVSGGRSNLLAADLHGRIAAELGIVDEPGWEARDVLVRSVAERARRIENLYELQASRWDLPPLAHRARSHVAVRTRSSADALDVSPSRSAGSRHPPELSGERVASLLEMLRLGRPAVALQVSDAQGWIAEQIPEWTEVRGRPQRDPYHVFHVDTHLIRTVECVNDTISRPGEAFSDRAVAMIGDDRTSLLLGALLHDIGKVGLGSHVSRGVEIAGRILDRMGVNDPIRNDVLFLVGEHLLLSDTATRRNLEDEDLIVHTAARIGDERRLAMLSLLTLADAQATGPSASTPWRVGLVQELVAKVGRVFERGLMDRDRAAALREAEAAIRGAMADLPAGEVDEFLQTVPPAYLAWVVPAEVREHVGVIIPVPRADEVRTSVHPGRLPGTETLVIGALDRLGLLAMIAGALTLSGLSIVSAQAFTTEHGVALDAFEVRGEFEDEIGPERWERFRSSLRGALAGDFGLKDRLAGLRGHYRRVDAAIPIEVRIDRDASEAFTVLEVGGPDRIGLLFDLASALAGQGVDVHAAKVATYGPRVIDAFYVTDEEGRRLSPDRADQVTSALRSAMAAP